jgi:drug/metabolite transporter (DMT)-like permease
MNPAYPVAGLGSVAFGAADFCGGIGARRASHWVVTFFSGIGGLLVLLAALPFLGGAPSGADLGWGAVAGATGALGAALIYRALAIGPVSVASPVLCLTGMVVPAIVGLVSGERPTAPGLAGLALVPVAIVLVTRTGDHPHAPGAASARRGLLGGLAAGAVIGFFLVFVSRIGPAAGLTPLVAARVVALALYVIAFTAARQPYLPPRGARAISFWTGVLDSCGNAAFLIASHGGSLALVSALVSLSPATTVLLGRFVLGERWSIAQAFGLAATLAAGALISLG